MQQNEQKYAEQRIQPADRVHQDQDHRPYDDPARIVISLEQTPPGEHPDSQRQITRHYIMNTLIRERREG